MKYVDEFRDREHARVLARQIAAEADSGREYRLMEFCGGHTHAIFRYGIPDLLPAQVRLVHGPGCPVCVLPVGRLDMALALARRPEVILCTYGDLLRVPGSDRRSLLQAKAEGADVRMLYSPAEALALARQYPQRQIVFFAIGFETTTPPTALVVEQAQREGLANFSVFCNHVLTPAAMHAILQSPLDAGVPLRLDGFIGPAHVSTVIGAAPYAIFPERYAKPVVIAGFEPLDLLQAILMLIRQLNDARCQVENQFSRAVTHSGNLKAQALMARVFERRDSFEWRGLGAIPHSALRLRDAYAEFDAEQRFELPLLVGRENRACECPAVLRGAKRPDQCALFGAPCTPDNPLGACMVSSEGACAAYYRYRPRQRVEVAT